MRKNETSIKDDIDFLDVLNEIIILFENNKRIQTATSGELLLLEKLFNIRELVLGNKPMKTKQENHISLQRILDDMPSIAVTPEGKRIYDIAYYFAYIYRFSK